MSSEIEFVAGLMIDWIRLTDCSAIFEINPAPNKLLLARAK